MNNFEFYYEKFLLPRINTKNWDEETEPDISPRSMSPCSNPDKETELLSDQMMEEAPTVEMENLEEIMRSMSICDLMFVECESEESYESYYEECPYLKKKEFSIVMQNGHVLSNLETYTTRGLAQNFYKKTDPYKHQIFAVEEIHPAEETVHYYIYCLKYYTEERLRVKRYINLAKQYYTPIPGFYNKFVYSLSTCKLIGEETNKKQIESDNLDKIRQKVITYLQSYG